MVRGNGDRPVHDRPRRSRRSRVLRGKEVALFLLAACALLEFPAFVWAEEVAPFPRGDGFYFSIPKLLVLITVYLIWVATCRWVDQDARRVQLPTETWNLILFGTGLAGLLVVWIFPWFWVSLILLVVLIAIPGLVFVSLRNERVSEAKRVLTDEHMQRLIERYLHVRLGGRGATEEEGPVVDFLMENGAGGHNPQWAARLAEMRGYKTAKLLLYDGLKQRATEIYLEPAKEETAVRYRIDGVLHAVSSIGRGTGEAVVAVFKTLAGLDTHEKRKPQEGSFAARISKRQVDFRVATSGSVAGEKLDLRILDASKQLLGLSRLGMEDAMTDQVRSLIQKPQGLFVVCGPPGSGRSTTLHACINAIDRYQKNVVTLENPIEYPLANVQQIDVSPRSGKSLVGELRQLLRQEPEVIGIHDAADGTTADLACQAVQTGRLVLVRLEAADAISAVGKLLDLGVQPFLLADALSGVLAQRLVRQLCRKCRVRYKPSADMLRKANLPVERIKYFYRPPESPQEAGLQPRRGEPEPVCEHCGGTGYRGRIGVFELLIVNDAIRDLIRENPNLNAIRREALKSGTHNLQEDCLRQVMEGKTSIQELLRISK
jgi:type II secretory ATPase GspE/PulE/Tfp pilus assembly ATPase PilB-like protein